MTDGDRRDYGPLLHAIEGLRDDMREDNRSLEERIMSAVSYWQIAHGAIHDSDKAANDRAHARFDEFIRSAELAQAHRDGALGVLRFAIELVSRNWKPLTTILAALATLLFAATANLQIEIVTR